MLHPLSLTNPHQPPFVVYHHAIRMGDVEDDEEAQMIHVTPIELSYVLLYILFCIRSVIMRQMAGGNS
jgi:hypothetical protein